MNRDIAIVGVGLNFPGAASPREFWDNLVSCRDLQSAFPRERFDCTAFTMPQNGYFLTSYPGFTPRDFAIKSNVAKQMDPMQWLALDTAREAFENSGLSQEFLDTHDCGVWCGVVSSDSYAQVALTPVEEYTAHTGMGCDQSMLSGRLAYHFNLTGPVMTINSACSSSLNAVILGAQALQCGQCALALVGGVHLFLHPSSVVIRARTGLLSPDGRCRSYDQNGQGYALGEGCGFVILETLEQARDNCHKILGIIRGYGQGHSGHQGALGQSHSQSISAVLEKALINSGLTADNLDFIEGHGSGTENGDLAELGAFAALSTKATHPLYLSSVKSHIGHLEGASGISGLITALLELDQQTILPAMHLTKLRECGVNTAGLCIPDQPINLPDATHYGLVCSSGLNGTTAALILQSSSPQATTWPTSRPSGISGYKFPPARPVIHRQEIATPAESGHPLDWDTILPALWREALGLDETMPLDRDKTFMELGGDSLNATYVINELCVKYQLPVEPVELLSYPTLNSLTAFLQELPGGKNEPAPEAAPAAPTNEPIAIIGACGRFPGAQDCREFWQNQLAGRVTYQQPEDDWGLFAASYFGYSAREAALIDPQQRQFLYQCWQLLRQTGYWQKESDIGVVAAAGPSTYLMQNLYHQHDFLDHHNNMEIMVANNLGSLAGRVCYKLNLCGPAFALDTHCSSALVALDEACQLLHSRRCKMVIAGGVSLVLEKVNSPVISPSGQCRPFSKNANGTVFKSGCGVVLLKPLSQARQDGDQILAIIKAARSNQDGANKAGMCAPAGQAQENLTRQVLATAGLQPRDITYVEAHGTGTVLGDKLELNALNNIFKNSGTRTIHLGCAKANIGHCLQASGMAALLKALYICQTGTLPPMLMDEPLNMLNRDDNPFILDKEPCHLPAGTEINILLCNLGFGGTNSQVIISSYPQASQGNDSLLFRQPEQLPQQYYWLGTENAANLMDGLLSHPENCTEEALIKLLKEASGFDAINRNTRILDLGFDSLLLVGLLAKLQSAFHRQLPAEVLLSTLTIGQLWEKLHDNRPRSPLDEVIMTVYRELFAAEIPTLETELSPAPEPLFTTLAQIYGLSGANWDFSGKISVITISDFISSQLNLLEIEEKSARFLKALQDE